MPLARTYENYIGTSSIRFRSGYVASPGEKFVGNNPYFHKRLYWTNPPEGSKAPSTIGALLNETGPSTEDYNKIYEKIREAIIGSKGELLTSVVEWRSSLDMISNRVVQLSRAYSAVKKLQFTKAAKILGLTRSQSKKVVRKVKPKDKNQFSPTSAWLEYWMGWAPLHGDIGHALEVLATPPPQSQKFSVGVGIIRKYSFVSINNSSSTGSDREIKTLGTTGHLGAYGNYKVTNHNLLVLNQLGFTNPALTAWQIVPFSFIVDWFTNVNQVLSSLTDFVGIEISRTGYGYTLGLTAGSDRVKRVLMPVVTYGVPRLWETYECHTSGWATYNRRTPGSIKAPQLSVVMLDRLSLTRAATSISLLVEIFLKK